MIKTVIFDFDGTLADTRYAVLNALKDTVAQLKNENIELSRPTFAPDIPQAATLEQLGIGDIEKGLDVWRGYLEKYSHTIRLFDGIETVIKEIKKQGYKIGIITSKSRKEHANNLVSFGLNDYFDTVICAEDSCRPKPSPDPILKYLEISGTKKEEAIYIGHTINDMQCATSAGVSFGLALWAGHPVTNIYASHYLASPADILYVLSINKNKPDELAWLTIAKELQFIGQAGITYCNDPFDRERFERIREISAHMISAGSGYPLEHVKTVFCNETGFQTPKLDTRAAIFQNNKILLVKENNGTWSLPGGWVDVNESIKSNTVKEVKEEAGLDVFPVKLIALQDRNLHNEPPYAYGVTKAFVLCEIIGGAFSPNIETIESNYFGLDELPPLAEEKNNAQQIKLCFDAHYAKNWNTVFD